MLKANLSSRPFYNERLVSLVLVAAGLGMVALTAWNVSRLTGLSETRASLERDIARDHSEAARIRADAESVAAGADLGRLRALVGGAAEANALIAHRTFSWTQFFDIVEGALPYEVRLVGVAHRIEGGERLLVLNLVAETDAQLNEFVRAMLETGVFFDVLPTEKLRNDDATVGATVETYYLPPDETGRTTGTSVAGGGQP